MTKIAFDTKTCGRCGGSGRYSYCAMYGTTCFQCAGSGKVYTAPAKKAIAAVNAFKLETFGKNTEDIKIGDRIKAVGVIKGYGKVVDIRIDGSYATSTVNGVPTRYDYITFVFNLKSGGTASTSMVKGTRVDVQPTTEQFAQLVNFARTLKGVRIETVEPVTA